MSFVNELFERLKASTTANDVQAALISLGNIQDPVERERAARETINLIERYAHELLERGQYKNAAYQYYSGSQVIHNFLRDITIENQWLRASADALAKASKEHISWDDLLGGAACMTIASLLRLQTGDWNINLHLDAFIKSHDFSANQAATACLYIPYDLAAAAKKDSPNPSLLQRASDYMESYLMNTKPAAMFQDGIKRAIEFTRQKLMDIVKFPSIRAAYEFDHDIIFGEDFKFIVKLENTGDGVANQVSARINIPESVTIITGSDNVSTPKLVPKEHIQGVFVLMCPSGEGKEEITIEISTNVNYEDILLNKNSISVGSALISIRTEKQAQKLMKQLKSLEKTISKRITPLETLYTPEIKSLVTNFKTILTNISSIIENNIHYGKFSTATLGINQLEQMQEFIQPLVEFLQQYSKTTQKTLEGLQSMKASAETLLQSLNDVEKQLSG